MTDKNKLPARFDDYEVHGVREFKRGAKGYCQQVPDEQAHFWSLYGHIPGQGLDCIGDFKSRTAAEEAYARITGRPYRDGTPPASENVIDVHQLLEDRRQVAVIWSTDDVQDIRPDLSEDQAWQVLRECRRVHDCEVGFTWLLIEIVANDLFPKQPSTTKE